MQSIKLSKLYWWLIIVLPIMDSVNGWINKGGNEGLFSLGILYRSLILVISICIIIKYNLLVSHLKYIIILIAYLVFSILLNNFNRSNYVTIIFKLVLPICIYFTISCLKRKNIIELDYIHSMFLIWRFLFPTTILLPYILGTGFNTYGTNGVGYKGFYYAQNDIGYVLAILYLFSIYEMWKKMNLKNIVAVLMLLICCFLLGLKSNYMIVAVVTVIYMLKRERNSNRKLQKFISLISIVCGVYAIAYIYQSEINEIINRWQYFYNVRSLSSFLTSARSDRIIPAYNWLINSRGVFGFLCGSGIEYMQYTVSKGTNYIEMDLFDIFFQGGFLEIVLIYGFFFGIFLKYKAKGVYKFAFILSIIISTLAGHVLESALPGMVFAIVCSGIMLDIKSKGKSFNE